MPTPSVAPSLTYSESADEQDIEEPHPTEPRRRRASTRLIAQSPADVQRITGESTTQLIKRCCGGGCCLSLQPTKAADAYYERVQLPDNDAFQSLLLKIDAIPGKLSNVCDLPEQTVFLQPISRPSNTPIPTELLGSSNATRDATSSIGDVVN